MQLWAMVFEGDWSVTSYSAFGNRVAWQMTSMPQYTVTGESDHLRRWQELDRAVLAKAVPIEATPEMLVGDLVIKAHETAQDYGLARADGSSNYQRFEDVWLASAVTDERFDNSSTVAEADLSDGDLVALCIEWHTGIGYMLGPASNPKRLFQTLQLVANVPRITAMPRLWGALLYTDEDTELATYVRAHFDELNALSGPLLGIFVVERPQSWASAKRYWQQHLEPPLLRTFSAMRWLSWKPYDRHLCYEIARELGVPSSRLPCLVLFRGADPTEILVFPIESASPAFLRGLFGEIERAVGQEAQPYDIEKALEGSRQYGREGLPEHTDHPGAWAKHTRDAIATMKSIEIVDAVAFDRVASAQRRILDELRPVKSPGTAACYEFHGYTVFTHQGSRR